MQKIKHPKTGALVTPAVFATMWKLTTTEESNDQGSWNNYQVEKVGLVENRDLLLEAKSFRESIAAGEVKAAPEEGVHPAQSPSPSREQDDEIPF